MHRWKEELILTSYEMRWTVRYFRNQVAVWDAHRIAADARHLSGPAAYARRKMAMWHNLASSADKRFMSVNRHHSLSNVEP